MNDRIPFSRVPAWLVPSSLVIILAALPYGCGGSASETTVGPNTTTTGDDNALINEALGYEGSISGKVVDQQSTRSSVDSAEGQSVPPAFDTSRTLVRFKDLDGDDLLDPNGDPIPGVPVDPDGSFTADGLPVGTDFTVCADIGDDGTCDIEGAVNIPSTDGGEAGVLSDARVDPLGTMILAKLRRLMQDRGIEPRDFPVSPAAIAARVVAAYGNLFEDAGIEQTITLDDILTLTAEAMVAFFDAEIPQAAQTGVRIAEGNVAAARAENAEELSLAAAEVFLLAGFPIMDLPGAPDLSALAALDGVTTTTEGELYGDEAFFDDAEDVFDALAEEFPDELIEMFPDGLPDELPTDLPDDFFDTLPDGFLDDLPDDMLGVLDNPAPQSLPGVNELPEETIYISTVVEPNRNFTNADDGGEDGGISRLPILTDHILLKMAELHLERRRITLADLYDLVTSLDDGLGMRLTYFVENANFAGPPLTLFQTADGKGKAINPERLFMRFLEEDFRDMDREFFERREGQLRALLLELLGDTIPPPFARLFDGFSLDRVGSVDELADRIRHARAHLPFNRTGPSNWFVVADADPFAPDANASAVTVDADLSVDGDVASVVYNANGDGRFYLGFIPLTEDRGIVELIVRETGRVMQRARGPVRVSMFDTTVFSPINGQPFGEFVSESGTFYPSTQITIIKDDFRFETLRDDERTALHEQILVLATGRGERSEPVHVDYNRDTGEATFNPFGRYVLMFLPESQETGLFALFNADTGRPARLEDPTLFFDRPHDRPERFEDFFNDGEDFDDLGELDELIPEGHDEAIPDDPNDEPIDANASDPPVDGDDANAPADGDGDATDPPADGDPADPPAAQTVPDDGTIVDEIVDEIIDDVPEDVLVDDVPEDVLVDEPSVDDMVTDEFDEPFPGSDHFADPGFILVPADAILGLDLQPEFFSYVFGIDAPNVQYDPDADPYFDDINGNRVQDPDEPTASWRPMLFDPRDWRSTDIRLYYRRADNNESVSFEEINWDSPTPMTIDGVELVRRHYVPRMNAFRFGRPNTAVNLLTAFVPPNFFDGTHTLTRDTSVDIFTAVSIINLVMDQVFNLEVDVDIDGFGPAPRRRMLIDAHPFIVPMDDPFLLLLRGFRERTRVEPPR